jgi:acetoin utilization protein AcuB
MEENQWIVTQEAADRLGVTPAWVRQLIAEGKLTGRKLGGKSRGQWLIKEEDIVKRLADKGEFGSMRVKNRMTRKPVTARPKTTYNEAMRLMERNDIQHLPILNKKDQLIGIVSHSDMLEAEPSRVSTLSVYEIASLLEKVTMDQIMSHPVKAISQECAISEAAHYMLEEEIGCLPVLDGDEVVGIITDTDIFKTFVEVTGGGEAGTRIEAKLPNEMGQLAAFTKAVTDAGSWIVSLAITYDESGDYFFIDMKERRGDEDEIRVEIEKLGTVEYIQFTPCSDEHLLSLG